MNAILGIVIDTWRQSRQQVVFMIMLGLLLITSITAVVLANPVDVTDEFALPQWTIDEDADQPDEPWRYPQE